MIFRGYMTATQIRDHFKALPGAQEIASDFAMNEIWQTYRDRSPESVLEVGHGIGTVTFLLAMWSSRRTQVIAVEDSPWCIEQARQNLGLMEGYVLWYDKVPMYESFDFVVVDGPQISDQQWKSSLSLMHRAVVIFEGNRRGQRAILEASLIRAGRHYCRVNLKPWDRSKGVWVYQVDPYPIERTQFWTLGVREWWRDVRARMQGRTIGKRRRG